MNVKSKECEAGRRRSTAVTYRGVRNGTIQRVLCMLAALMVMATWVPGASAFKPKQPSKDKPRERMQSTSPPRRAGATQSDLPSKRGVTEVKPDVYAPGAPRPKVDAGDGIHDFGEVWVGPMLQHSFMIKNTGDAPLKIYKVKPSCGCTIAGKYPKEIAPGETGSFPFSVASTKLRGKFEKPVTVTTSDPSNPSIRLRLRGQVKRYVDILPAAANFGKLVGSEKQERVLKLTNNTDKPLTLTLGTELSGGFSATLVVKEPGQVFDLVISAGPPFDPGMFRKTLTINTNVEAQPVLKVPVRGSVPTRLDVNPVVLSVGQLPENGKLGKKLIRTIRFTNYGSTPATLLEATSDDPNIKLTIDEQNPGKSYSIEVEIPAGTEIPSTGRMVTLKTSDEKKPTIEVPIRSSASRRKPTTASRRPAEDLVGKPGPAFALKTIEDKTLANPNGDGMITVLDFWAPNCGFCKKQIPTLEKVRAEFEGKPVRFVAVSQTMRNQKFTDAQVKDVINGLGFKGELALDGDNTVGPLFQATSYPTMVVLGKTGKVEAVNIGNLGDLQSRLKTQLDALIAGKAVPKVAKLERVEPTPAVPTQDKPKPAARKRADSLIGTPGPAFTMSTFGGKVVSNTEFGKNAATVLNFVAGNCGYCKKQIPRLEKIRQQYESKGVRFVNVVETMRKEYTRDEVIAVLDQTGSKLEIAHDPKNDVGRKYLANGFPTMVVVGKTGKVEAVNIGNVGDLESRMKTQLDAIIAGKSVPTIAAKPPAEAPQRQRADSLIGQPAPMLTATTFGGKSVTNAEFAKHPATVLNFVATNCGYCKKQIPRLEKIRQEYEAKGVRFVNVVETMRKEFTKDEVIAVLDQTGSKLEVSHDPKNVIGRNYLANGFPTMVVVGKSGKVEAVNIGNIGDLESRMKTQLDAMIAGKPVPTVAAKPPAKRPERKRADSLIGTPAPALNMTTFGGKAVANADFAKHPATVLNFVAGNCGYCKKQIPRLEKIRQEYEAKGIRFVNVVETMRKEFTKDEVIAVLDQTGSKLEVAHDPKNVIGRSYLANGFPTMVVVGKSGKVEAVNIGNVADLETRMKGQLDALIAGKALPKVAAAPPAQSRRRPAEDMVGKPAPAFALTTLAGKPLSSADLKSSSATVLNFVAPNCGYCKKALPSVEKVRQEYEAKGVRFVNVAQKMRQDFTQDQIVDIFKKAGSQLEVTIGDFGGNAVGKDFKATSFPTMFVVDKNGKVAHVNIGAKPNLDTLLKGQLDALIK